MNEFIEQELICIEQAARRIVVGIHDIIGYCNGQETVANLLFPNTQGNGYDNQSTTSLMEEIKLMIVDLQIKGSVRQRPNGLIEFRNTTFGSIYGRSKEDIEKQLKIKIKQLKNNPEKDKRKKNTTPLLSEFFRFEYLPYKQRQGRKTTTMNAYESNIKFIKEQNFDKPLNSYKTKEIENFLYSFPETRKRQNIQGLLNNMFNRAIAMGIIKSNPNDPLERAIHIQKRGEAFSFDEQVEFFSSLFSNQHLSYADKCYLILIYLVGARRNELLDLSVENVDIKSKILDIDGTKTTGSRRSVPLTPLIEKCLLSMKITKGKYFNITETQADEKFRKIWKKEKGHKLHDLRHTFGTIQICAKKIDIKTVSLWMGHSSIETTLDYYTHPEQLDKSTFLRGDITEEQKTVIYKQKYDEILKMIDEFLSVRTQ